MLEIGKPIARMGNLDQRAKEEQLRAYYYTLIRVWGRQHWWPARTRFEVIVGAYLTQNTAWTNVELALGQLRAARLLCPKGIRDVPLSRLEAVIRSSGYFRQKARRLKMFVEFLDLQYQGSLHRMFAQPTEKLREQLLRLEGVGTETADSILLYAGQHPVFVVDAYTRRIFARHGILPDTAPYEEIRELAERALAELSQLGTDNENPRTAFPTPHRPSAMSQVKRSAQAQVYNDMHGLIVGVGKHYCHKSQPQCDGCPLRKFLPAVT
jgi:endonuclease-3 related protein